MIRRATAADLNQILRIERAAFTAPHWPWEAYEQMLERSEHVQRTLLVDVLSGAVRGFAGGSLITDEAQLESIAVLESTRRQGLGRELCAAFLDWAQGHGARSVGLEVRAASEGVQRLYAGLGFFVIGRRPSYYSNPVEDGILMSCVLEQKTKLTPLESSRKPNV